MKDTVIKWIKGIREEEVEDMMRHEGEGRGKVSQEEDKQVEKVQQGEDGGGGVGERGEVLQEIDKR